MCDRWRFNFWNFVEDMGPKPSRLHSVDRINNDGPYSPENCRWATRKEQDSNTRRNRFITHNGVTLTLAEWSEKTGLAYCTILSRVKKGYVGDRLFIPPLIVRHAR